MIEVKSRTEIILFVDSFYLKVREDELIGPIFQSVIKDSNWQPHLDKMYSFWDSILFGQSGYRGNPFSKHSPLPIQKEHFDRWLALFSETLEKEFTGEKAEEAIARAKSIGHIFRVKIEYLNREVD